MVEGTTETHVSITSVMHIRTTRKERKKIKVRPGSNVEFHLCRT